MFDLQNHRGFYGLNIEPAGLFGIKTAQIGNPVIFCSELDVMLFPTFIYRIHFKAAGNHESEVAADIAFLLDKPAPLYFALSEMRCQFIAFNAIKRKVLLKISDQVFY